MKNVTNKLLKQVKKQENLILITKLKNEMKLENK